MTLTTISIIAFILLILFFIGGVPVGFAMALVGFLGFGYVVSIKSAVALTATVLWTTFSSYTLTVLPMFVFMGSIAFHSGMSRRLFETMRKLFGRQRGGLAIATIFGCAGFSAVCGSTNATAAAMGKVALPEMKKYGYSPSLATGCVAAGGTLGILIPPSAILIIYATMTEQSIGKLFAAGIFPGIILTILFAATVFIICRLNPRLAPRGASVSWKTKLASLGGMGDTAVLFALVMGGLFAGFFTPTEAGGIGAAGALIIALARRQFTWQGFRDSLVETTRISCMVFIIVSGAVIFSRFLAVTRVPFELAEWVVGLPFSTTTILWFIICGYLIGGCFMDALGLITLTVPIFFPLLLTLNIDPIWFGVTIVLVTEMGVITPPVGINVYVIKGVAPDVPLESIFKGIFPFLGAIIATEAILIAWPQIATFLPSLM